MQMPHDLDLAIRDSVQLENCKTEGELHYAVRNIEARHAVEGISAKALELWEQEKRRHIARIYRTIAA
jgi:hypothetical protein